MAFGSGLDNFLNGVFKGLTSGDNLKDYSHANKTFASDGYALAPQTKYLFHVYFTLNTTGIPALQQTFGATSDFDTLGMLVKSADLPKYRIDVDTYNQYNRKRYVQSKINYEPVSITFHDDGSDLIRSMWNAYYSYYYADSGYSYDNLGGSDLASAMSSGPNDWNRRDIYDQLRNTNNWGYSGSSPTGDYKPNFFKDIKIYGLNRGNYVQYTLINPIITAWAHDTFDYSDGGGTMSNQVQLMYETVKYSRGTIGDPATTEVRGFMDPSKYDSSPSKLSKPGATASLFGQAGLVDAVTGIGQDLASGNILGAVTKGLTAANTVKDAPAGLSGIVKGGADSLVTGIASAAVSSFSFPKTLTNNQALSSSNTLVSGQEYNSQASSPADVNSNGTVVNSQWKNPDA